MPILKIGIQTRSLRQPLRRALATAAQLGADGVQVDVLAELPPDQMSATAIRSFRKLLGDLGLRISAVSLFPGRQGNGGSSLLAGDELERRIALAQSAMRLAYAIGADVVTSRVGRLPDDEAAPQYRQGVEALTVLGHWSVKVGARLALRTDHQTPDQLARLLAALPEASVGVDFHPAALEHAGHEPAEALAALAPHVLHVTASDTVAGPSLRFAKHVELGRGTVDWPLVLGSLEEINYRGWLTLESPHAADPRTEMGNAVAYLRSLG